jgi:trans-aconitate methyltransferase
MRRVVRDDPMNPDPGFAELYGSFPDATELEPWLRWCRAAKGPVLYLGIGAGRLAVPLAAAGVSLVGVDVHPGMLERLRRRLPEVELVEARIEELELGRRFPLVIGPSSILGDAARLAVAARHSCGRVGFEVMNPHWLLAGAHATVRVLAASHRQAEIEVDYPGGWTHRGSGALYWPEDVERRLAGAGLELEVMRGQDPNGSLGDSATYFVLARVVPARVAGRGH